MLKEYVLLSGLPRSGSTLLCNILAQNPEFYVSPATSGCHDVLFGIRNQWDHLIEHKAAGVNYDTLRSVLQGALAGYHPTDKKVIIDKGRGWLSLVELAQFILNGPVKVITTVRDIAEILASFEMLWRKSTGQSQWSFEKENYIKSQTTAGRCEIWADAGQVVGLAYNRLKDAFARGHKKSILIVEADDLTSHPLLSMQRIYDFIGKPYFEHDFLNVEQYTQEDDAGVHRIPGLHTIRKEVKPLPRKASEILGYNLAKKYSQSEFWRAS